MSAIRSRPKFGIATKRRDGQKLTEPDAADDDQGSAAGGGWGCARPARTAAARDSDIFAASARSKVRWSGPCALTPDPARLIAPLQFMSYHARASLTRASISAA